MSIHPASGRDTTFALTRKSDVSGG